MIVIIIIIRHPIGWEMDLYDLRQSKDQEIRRPNGRDAALAAGKYTASGTGKHAASGAGKYAGKSPGLQSEDWSGGSGFTRIIVDSNDTDKDRAV